MGLGLEGAYGAAGAADALRQIIKDRFERQAALHAQSVQDRELTLRGRSLDQNDQFRRDQLERQSKLDSLADEDRNLNIGLKLNDQIPGGFLPAGNQAVGFLRKIGAGQDVPATQAMGPGFEGPMPNAETPQQAQVGRVRGFLKSDSEKQRTDATSAANVAADNARADATAQEATRRFDITAAEDKRYHTGMINKPTSGGTVVVQTPTGPQIVDKNARTATPVTGTDGAAIPPTPTAQQRNTAASYGKARPIIQGIAELSEKINIGEGIAATARGIAEQQKAKINLSDDVAEYESLIEGFTPLVARALGHTGVLTQQDVDSVKRMFPNPKDSKALRDRKVARLESLMKDIEEGTGGAPPKKKAGPKFEIVSTKD